MTINGKDITVKALLETNRIHWTAYCIDEIHTMDIVSIQSLAGYPIYEHGSGQMNFSRDGKQCDWYCFVSKQDYNDCFPTKV